VAHRSAHTQHRGPRASEYHEQSASNNIPIRREDITKGSVLLILHKLMTRTPCLHLALGWTGISRAKDKLTESTRTRQACGNANAPCWGLFRLPARSVSSDSTLSAQIASNSIWKYVVASRMTPSFLAPPTAAPPNSDRLDAGMATSRRRPSVTSWGDCFPHVQTHSEKRSRARTHMRTRTHTERRTPTPRTRLVHTDTQTHRTHAREKLGCTKTW
jgi:hypothetical protein